MDSPKHIACLERGLTGQYYRIAGKNKYKCKSCGNIEKHEAFEPIEFDWKDNSDGWHEWLNDKMASRGKKTKGAKK